MTVVRHAAVAGLFYPDHARELQEGVRQMLAEAGARSAAPGPAPKAVIAPHAGYVYSGAVAASAYARLQPLASLVRRVVLIGPCHRVPLRGLAVPQAEAFETPLGRVPLDRAAIAEVLTLPQVRAWDPPHEDEHSLEVHLPFLQTLFPEFSLVPLVAGDASEDEVAAVLERLWGGPETLIVVSSDLSHYLDYTSARKLDARTCRAIETLDGAAIGWEQACGRMPVAGLLAVARRKGLSAQTLDLRNSGDTAGDRRRVVGYGAWAFAEPSSARRSPDEDEQQAPSREGEAGAERALLERHGATLLHVAAASIEHGLRFGRALPVTATEYAAELREQRACFVTLYLDDRLRGCVGSADAYRPLVEDVAGNGFAAAFRDDRFPRLDEAERAGLQLSVSVLSPAWPLRFVDEPDLLRQLRPGADGVILEAGGRRAVFLPQVWEHLREPHEFIGQLKVKAGLARDYWSDGLQARRFSVECISTLDLPQVTLWS